MEEVADVGPHRTRGQRIKRVLLWLVSIIVVLVAIFWGLAQRNAWSQFKTDLTNYKGLTIGQTKTEVQYALGAPQTVQGPETAASNGWKISNPLRVNPHEQNKDILSVYPPIPSDKSAVSYDEWHYLNEDDTFDVDFEEKSHRVESITCWIRADKPADYCEPLFGVSSGAVEDEIRASLGKPDKEQTSGGETFMGTPIAVVRRLEYHKLGLNLTLEKRRVITLTKKAPNGAGFWWWLRHGRP